MLDRQLIQTRGFKNRRAGDVVSGFQLRLRMPSYRGMWVNLIDGVDVTVDQHTWTADQTRWEFDGHEYSLEELRRSSGVRWQLEEAATVVVPAPGGLDAGVHEVEIALRLRMSYIPVEHQPTVFTDSRKVTIVE